MAKSPQNGWAGFDEFKSYVAYKAAKKAERRSIPQESAPMSITSIMDAFTILLVYLLMNFAVTPTNITASDDLKLSTSKSIDQLTQAAPIAITKKFILVDDQPVVQVKNGRVPSGTKRDGDDGFYITPVVEAAAAWVAKQKEVAAGNKAIDFKNTAMIVVDRDTPYRLVTEVLYSVGQAEFANFEFAVIQGG